MTTSRLFRSARTLRLPVALAVATLTMLIQPRPSAADDDSKFGVDVIVGWGKCYRPNRWMPIDLAVTSRHKEPVEAVISIEGQQDELTRAAVMHKTVFTPGQLSYVPLATKLIFGEQSVDIRVRPTGRQKGWENREPLDLRAVTQDELLIGICGVGSHGPRLLGGYAVVGRSGTIHVSDRRLEQLPWDWTGYDCLDLLVLCDLEWDRLNAHQSRAIVDWVSKGGRLLIVPGGQPMPAGHPLAAMMPVSLDQPRQISGGAGRRVNQWFTAEQARAAAMDVENARGDIFAARRGFGFGWVAVLSASPADLGMLEIDKTVDFWSERLSFLLGKVISRGDADEPDSHKYMFQTGQEGQATNKLLAHLFEVPELRPLNVWWVVLLLAAMAVVLGPIDYVLLKKLDRLPWTWVTCSGLIVLFTIGAYHGVKLVRAGSTTVRSVSFIDVIDPGAPAGRPGQQIAWSTCYTGVFASDSEDYRLTNLGQGQWWSSVCPTSDNQIYSHGQEFTARRICTVQRDGANVPDSVPISIWSMQCLISEQRLDGSQVPLAATVRSDGDDLVVRVMNHSDVPIASGAVDTCLGGIPFGSVPGKSTTEFRGRVSQKIGADWNEWASAAGIGCRSEAIRQASYGPSVVVCAKYFSNISPHAVAGPCVQDHVQWVRLVVPVKNATE